MLGKKELLLTADWYSYTEITTMAPKKLNIKLPLKAVSKGLLICQRSGREQLNIHDNTDQTDLSYTAAQPL